MTAAREALSSTQPHTTRKIEEIRSIMKSIYETLAALGTGAILLSGCAPSSSPNAKAPSVEIPASPKESGAAESSAGAEAAGDTSQAAAPEGDAAKMDNAAASPADAAAPATTAMASAAPKAKAPPKATAKKGTGKKKDTAGGCGEGTCG